MKTNTIIVMSVGEKWVDYRYSDSSAGGAIHKNHFPKVPVEGEKYTLITRGSVILEITLPKE